MFRHLHKVASTTSDRVKAVEFHPTEPMLAAALYNGTVVIFNTNDMSILRTIRVDASKAIRCVRWMTSLNCIIAAGDNLTISCYDYNTGSLIASKSDAHTDFVRQIAVHPTQTQFISCSDDGKINLYSINKSTLLVSKVYDGHEHFVMDVKFNPVDEGVTFATASLDSTIKFWGLTSQNARFTLKGHQAGVNCIEFFPGRDKPHLASGSDDFSIKIWDYQTKSCVITLSGHRANVTSLKFHPVYPLLISTAEDEMLNVWNVLTFKHETTLNNQKKRGWCLDANQNFVVVGYDDGLVLLKIGRDAVVVITMNSTGRAYWAKNNEIQSASLAQAKDKSDGMVDIIGKEVATSEFYPSIIAVNSTGKFIGICDDNEYSISSALAWRAQGSGQGKEIVWGIGDVYAVRTGGDNIQVFQNLKSFRDFTPQHECDRIFGGFLLGVADSDSISFFNWTDLSIVRQIDVYAKVKGVWWSLTTPTVAISTAESLFILQFDENYANAEDFDRTVGSASAFSIIADRETKVTSGCWYSEVFFFTDDRSVYFFVGGHFEIAARPGKSLNLIGYVHQAESIFLCDGDYKFYKYRVPVNVLNFYITASSGDVDNLDDKTIPDEWKSRLCAFLENLELFDIAFQLADTDDKRFDLALKRNDVDTAARIADNSKSMQQWRHLAGISLKTGRIDLLETSLIKAGDESGAILLKSCKGNGSELRQFAEQTEAESKNVSFTAYFAVGNFDKCIDLLLTTGRAPEAALMARAYAPRKMDECAQKWKELLIAKGEQRRAEMIALPKEYPNLFGMIDEAVELESAAPEPESETTPELESESESTPETAAKPETIPTPEPETTPELESAPTPETETIPVQFHEEEEEEEEKPNPEVQARVVDNDDDEIAALLRDADDAELADF
jgi:coatomer subunit beta'